MASEFIVSGAAVSNQYVETETLHALLVDRGVDPAHIWLEAKAQHTDENLYYSRVLTTGQGWTTAVVVSDAPGQWVHTALCEANCCVDLGRMTLCSCTLAGALFGTTLGHFVLYPDAAAVTQLECDHIQAPTKAMCIKLPDRKACQGNLLLE